LTYYFYVLVFKPDCPEREIAHHKAREGYISQRWEEEIMNIAEKIMQGSKEIDQKKKLICLLVEIMISELDTNDLEMCSREGIIFKFPWWLWWKKDFWRLRYTNNKVTITYETFLLKSEGFFPIYKSDGKIMPGAYSVPDVYGALPMLVKGMIKKQPSIEVRLWTYFKAYKKRSFSF